MWDFSDSEVKKNDFEPIPAGVYIMQVESSEVKPTKAGDGKFFNLRLRITGGNYKNRVIFHRFNVENKSAKAQEIGRSELKSLMIAGGKTSFKLESPRELEGLTMAVKLGQENDRDGKVQNKVLAFLPMSSANMSASQSTTTDSKSF